MLLHKRKATECGDDEKTDSSPSGWSAGPVLYDGWRCSLLPYDELPLFLKDNEYLLTRHRPPLPVFLECAKTTFRVHTETVNIWTHLLGCVGFAVLMLHYLAINTSVVGWAQRVTFTVYFIGCLICLGCSTIYHIFQIHSNEVCNRLSKYDYCGIIFLIVTSFLPWVYFGFYCQPAFKVLYLTAIFTLGVIGIAVVLHDEFRTREYRPFRAGLFMTMGLSGLVPGLHYILTHNLEENYFFIILLLSMAVFYLSGGSVYACRIPERLSPGKFDIWCHSHQFLHMCVIAGALCGFYGASELALHKLSNPGLCDVI